MAKSDSDSDSDTEEEEVDTRTDEQKQQDEIANTISSEIARVESLGYKFNEGTRWAVVAAYLDAKELFDDEGLDLISCDVGEKKKITLGNVTKKIAELRAAAAEKQKAVVPLANGESQFDFDVDSEEEEAKDEEEEDWEDWDTLPEAQLNARISEMKKDLGLKTNQAKIGPVTQVLTLTLTLTPTPTLTLTLTFTLTLTLTLTLTRCSRTTGSCSRPTRASRARRRRRARRRATP